MDTQSAATTSYSYDARGNLTQVVLATGDVIEYIIDGLNRRVAKKKNGAIQQLWLYRDGLHIAAELDGAGALASRFVYASRQDVPDFVVRGSVTYRIVSDHLGSPRLVVNASNANDIKQRLSHDAWGRVFQDSSPGWLPFGFASGLYDPDTGLVRFGARDYDPESGRWTARDPILFAGGQSNLYAYVNNDPVNFTDPKGLIAGVDDAAILAGLGAAAAATALYGWCVAGGCEAVGNDLQQGWQNLVNWADNAREKDLLKHLGDMFGVPWKQLSDEFHKIKEKAGLKGKPVGIAPDGTVTDPASGEEIGNICDK